jgi:Spy/CpxP family protein refolding chaperone
MKIVALILAVCCAFQGFVCAAEPDTKPTVSYRLLMSMLHDMRVRSIVGLDEESYRSVERYGESLLRQSRLEGVAFYAKIQARSLAGDFDTLEGAKEQRELLNQYRAEAEDRTQQVVDKIFEEVLTPEQVTRLKELYWQKQAYNDTLGALIAANVIDDTEALQFIDLAVERRKELEQIVKEHRDTTDQMILKKLSPEQQKKWKSLIGKSLEEDETWELSGRGSPDLPGTDRGTSTRVKEFSARRPYAR